MHKLFKVLFSIGTILFVGILGILIYSLVKFRRRAGDLGDGIPMEDNLPLEILWTIIPTIVILFVGLYSYDIYDRMGGMQSLNHGSMHSQQLTNKGERIMTEPIAKKVAHTTQKHRKSRVDNYHWMRLTDKQKDAKKKD